MVIIGPLGSTSPVFFFNAARISAIRPTDDDIRAVLGNFDDNTGFLSQRSDVEDESLAPMASPPPKAACSKGTPLKLKPVSTPLKISSTPVKITSSSKKRPLEVSEVSEEPGSSKKTSSSSSAHLKGAVSETPPAPEVPKDKKEKKDKKVKKHKESHPHSKKHKQEKKK